MIIVTGASGGIGNSLIKYLSSFDQVVGIYNNHKPNEVDNVIFAKVDLLNSESINAFISKFKDQLNNITIIHGAVLSIDQLAIKYEEEDWDKVIDVNLKSNYVLTKALLPFMLEKKYGRIISLSSVVGVNGAKGTLAYSASKMGVYGLSRVYTAEYARFNITSNVITLGYFESGLIDTLGEKQRQEIISKIPSNKLGDVNNIFYAIKFLIESNYCNGSVITIDGGL
jgi:3-oxoacyl-[acyl-carrier protein] reductase